MQNIPRGGKGEGNWVKEMFVAAEGHTLWERDFSGIEAVLTGYFAGSPGYIRLAKRDVHTFYTAYAINALDPGRVLNADLPLLAWDDGRLFSRLSELKKVLKNDRNDLYKHLVHGANYLQTPAGAADHIFKSTGKAFDRRLVARVMGIYFELFPEIRQWHRRLTSSVDGARTVLGVQPVGEGGVREAVSSGCSSIPVGMGVAGPGEVGTCYVKNPFGYVHRFYNVLDWDKIDGKWESSYGEDAKRLVSFLPQSTAAAIIKQAAKRLFYEHPWVGDTLRLLIHDSTLGESKDNALADCLSTSKSVMEAPIVELPLDPAWGMGDFLSINSEAKVGKCWGAMKEAA